MLLTGKLVNLLRIINSYQHPVEMEDSSSLLDVVELQLCTPHNYPWK